MKDEEKRELGFTQEQLDEDLNEMGTRWDNLETADFEFTKQVLEYGGLDAVDAYLDSTWSAWYCASSLIKVVDSLFYADPCDHELDNPKYEALVNKAVKEVFESMILALENAETEIHYDHDPHDIAENRIEGFAYGLIDDVHSMISEDETEEVN